MVKIFSEGRRGDQVPLMISVQLVDKERWTKEAKSQGLTLSAYTRQALNDHKSKVKISGGFEENGSAVHSDSEIDDKVRITVVVDRSRRNRWKEQARTVGLNLTAFIRKTIEEKVSKPSRKNEELPAWFDEDRTGKNPQFSIRADNSLIERWRG